ncbi:MAG: hypothetical protein ABSF29_14810 [Tepidisphaeraceae bacterium]
MDRDIETHRPGEVEAAQACSITFHLNADGTLRGFDLDRADGVKRTGIVETLELLRQARALMERVINFPPRISNYHDHDVGYALALADFRNMPQLLALGRSVRELQAFIDAAAKLGGAKAGADDQIEEAMGGRR